MCWCSASNHPAEFIEGRSAREVKEVARASAVAGAESQDRCVGLRQHPDYFCPLVLPGSCIRAEPKTPHGRSSLKIVYMPSLPLRSAAMVSAARPQAARPEGAADVDIPTWPEVENAQTAHLPRPGAGALKDESIGARRGRDGAMLRAFKRQDGHIIGSCLQQQFQRPAVRESL